MTVKLNDPEVVLLKLSVTLIIKVAVVAVAGVPEKTPLLEKDIPVGKVPEVIAQVYPVSDPPVACMVAP